MSFYDIFNVVHTTVAHSDSVFIKNFPQRVVFVEVLQYKVDKLPGNIGFNRRAVWRVKPHNLALSAPLLIVIYLVVFQFGIVARFLQCQIVITFVLVELFFVT